MRKMPICNIKLSTGYKIPIDYNKFDKDMDHLTNALIGEVFVPNTKNLGIKKATRVLQDEIVDFCEKLSSKSKTALLSTIIWNVVCKKHNKIMKSIKVKKKKK